MQQLLEGFIAAVFGGFLAGLLGFTREQIKEANKRERFYRDKVMPLLERMLSILEKLVDEKTQGGPYDSR
jgi:hypothetical protein